MDLDLFERMTEEQRIAVLLPPDRLLQSLAPVKLDEEATKKFLNGMKVRTNELRSRRLKCVCTVSQLKKLNFYSASDV